MNTGEVSSNDSENTNTQITNSSLLDENEIVKWIDKDIGDSLVNDTFFDIIWGNASSPETVVKYKIYLNDSLYTEVDSSVHRISIIDLKPETKYKIEIVAVDTVGNISIENPIKYITTTDQRYANRNIIFNFPYNLKIEEENYEYFQNDPYLPVTKISKIDSKNLIFLKINGELYIECRELINTYKLSSKDSFHFLEIGYSSFDVDLENNQIYFLYSNSPVNQEEWDSNLNNKAHIYITKYNFQFDNEGCVNIDLSSKNIFYKQLLYWKSHTNGDLKIVDGNLIFSLGDNVTYGSSVDPNKNSGKIFSFPLSTVIETEEDMNNFKIGIGFRNPYRFEVINNLIYVFDVGQTDYEEINILNTAKSNVQDFGWPYYEGRKTYQSDAGVAGMERFIAYNNLDPGEYKFYDLLDAFADERNDEVFTMPFITYEHRDNRCAIIGADVINQKLKNEELVDYLIFADYCSGEIFINNFKVNSSDIIIIYKFSEQLFIYDIEILETNEILISTSNGIRSLKVNY